MLLFFLPKKTCLFHKMLFSQISESVEVDVTGLPRGGTRYSSTSSLNSVTTASSPQTLQPTSTTSNIHNQTANSGAVCQTQDINLARGSRESPLANSMPGAAPVSSISTPQVLFSFFNSTMIKLFWHHVQGQIVDIAI